VTGWTREQVNFCHGRIVDQAVVGGRVTSVGAGDCGEDSGAGGAGGGWASLPNATGGIGRQAAVAGSAAAIVASDASIISSTLPNVVVVVDAIVVTSPILAVTATVDPLCCVQSFCRSTEHIKRITVGLLEVLFETHNVMLSVITFSLNKVQLF